VGEDGRLVAGRYRLQQSLGHGAMGAVWKAYDERLGRTVVVKRLVLPPGLTEDDAAQARLRAMREGRIAARLQHPNAVAVYDVTDDGDQPVLVMEYLPSRSLAAVLAERGTLPPGEVADIGAQAAAALAAAHAAGIVHRDVKPGNLLIGDDGAVKISDFGISRAVDDVTVTATGLLIGTPAFMAPEAAKGHEPAPASDVFSLGSTLYAAAEGRPPFGLHDNAIALLHKVAAGRFPPPASAGPLTELLMGMLRADPATRPGMAEVSEDLRAVAAGHPAPTRVITSALSARPARTARAPSVAGQALPPTRLDLQRDVDELRAAPRSAAATGRPATSRPTTALIAAMALLAAVVVGMLLAGLPLRPDRPGGDAASQAEQPGPAAAVDPAQLQRAVAEYFALLPEDTDEAWTRLGPALQAQGEDRFEDFWKDVEDLRVIEAPTVTGDRVRVGIEYTAEKRGRFREFHALGVLIQDGAPLINSDELLSAQRIGGETKGKGGKRHDDDGDG